MKPTYFAKFSYFASILALTSLTLTGCVPNLIKQPPAGNASHPTHVKNPVALEIDWTNVQLTSGPSMSMDSSNITSQFTFNGSNAKADICLAEGTHQFSVSARQNPTPHLINEVLTFFVDPRFTINPLPEVKIDPGSSQNVTVTIVRDTNFNDAVDLMLTGLPAGVTGPSTVNIPFGSNSANFTLTAAATAAPGTSTVTISATSVCRRICNCVDTTTSTVNVSVPAPTFSLDNITPTDVFLERDGAAQPVTVTLLRTGGDSSLAAITLSGLSAGVSSVPAPLTIAGTANSGSLTLQASLDAALGKRSVTVTATGTHATGSPKPINVTVVPKTGAFAVVSGYTRNTATQNQATVGAPGNSQRMATVRSNTNTTANQDFQAQFSDSSRNINSNWLDFWNDYRLPTVQTGAAFCANKGRYGILKGGFAGNYGGDPFQPWEYEISFIDMSSPSLVTRFVWHGDRFFNVRGTPPGGPSDSTDPTVLLSPDCTYAVIVSAVTDRSIGPERRRVDVINLDTGNSAGSGPLFFGDPNVQPLFPADLSAVLVPSSNNPARQEVQLLLKNANWQKVTAP